MNIIDLSNEEIEKALIHYSKYKESLKKYSKKYYEKNKDIILENMKKQKKENYDKEEAKIKNRENYLKIKNDPEKYNRLLERKRERRKQLKLENKEIINENNH
jgi:GTPase involved in cell partitioning and DNA repair